MTLVRNPKWIRNILLALLVQFILHTLIMILLRDETLVSFLSVIVVISAVLYQTNEETGDPDGSVWVMFKYVLLNNLVNFGAPILFETFLKLF